MAIITIGSTVEFNPAYQGLTRGTVHAISADGNSIGIDTAAGSIARNVTGLSDRVTRVAPDLIAIGSTVTFSPGYGEHTTGVVTEQVDVGHAEYQAYRIAYDTSDLGSTVHRWQHHENEHVELVGTEVPAAALVAVPDMSTLSAGTIPASTLQVGQHFVWPDTREVRDWLVATREHVLGIYRVIGRPYQGALTYELVGPDTDVSTGSVVTKSVGTLRAHVFISEHGGAVATEPVQETVAAHRNVLPRTASEAALMIHSLTKIARYLPGGELNTRADELAERVSLCGEYEAIACPTFGWTPRNGEGSSMMSRTQMWRDTVKRFEDTNEGLAVADLLARYATVYDRGAAANEAVVQHAENHLEAHKREDVNELLSELDWDLIDVSREYEVRVRVTRTRTVYVTEEQYVTRTIEASSEDDAEELAREGGYDFADYAGRYDWSEVGTDEGDTDDVEEDWDDVSVELA